MDWTILNDKYSDILDDVRSEWNSLMSQNYNEEQYHKFIAEHSSMCWGNNFYFSISKLDLGGKFIPDFVLVSENGSLGLQYTLVEIEKPCTQSVTQQGDSAVGLTHAIGQIRNWKHWIKNHIKEAGELFPSKFSSEGDGHINYMLIIGKRSELDFDKELERYKQGLEVGYEIRTFDYITDNLKSYRAYDFIHPNSDVNSKYWEEGLFYEFANPFFKSIDNKEWQKLVRNPDLVRTHMIGQNIKIFNDVMKANEKYNNFTSRIEQDKKE